MLATGPARCHSLTASRAGRHGCKRGLEREQRGLAGMRTRSDARGGGGGRRAAMTILTMWMIGRRRYGSTYRTTATRSNAGLEGDREAATSPAAPSRVGVAGGLLYALSTEHARIIRSRPRRSQYVLGMYRRVGLGGSKG